MNLQPTHLSSSCNVSVSDPHWVQSAQWERVHFLPSFARQPPLLCCSSGEKTSPRSHPINHADEFTSSHVQLPAIHPDCTRTFLRLSYLCFLCLQSYITRRTVLAPSLPQAGVKPDGGGLPTREQLNAHISADWFITLILFDLFSWLTRSKDAFKLQPLSRINRREQSSVRLTQFMLQAPHTLTHQVI